MVHDADVLLDVAVMVAVPCPMPVTKPVRDTVATAALLVAHVAPFGVAVS